MKTTWKWGVRESSGGRTGIVESITHSKAAAEAYRVSHDAAGVVVRVKCVR